MVTDFNPFVAQRRRNMLELLDMIKKNKNIEEKQLVALFCLKTGLKRETVKAMLGELQDAGAVDEVMKEDEQVHDAAKAKRSRKVAKQRRGKHTKHK